MKCAGYGAYGCVQVHLTGRPVREYTGRSLYQGRHWLTATSHSAQEGY
jgi:hypothetical protein